MYEYNGYYIPTHMVNALKRYIEHGILPGDFLQAIISNDFMGAFSRADTENSKNMRAYAAYMYNEMPSDIIGSKEIMMDYSKKKWEEAFAENERELAKEAMIAEDIINGCN